MASRFGELLRKHRQRAGLTQEQLAERAAVSEKTIRDLETKPSSNPRVDTVELIAKALDLAPDERQIFRAAAAGVLPPEQPQGRARGQAAPDAVCEAADHLALVLGPRLREEEEQLRLHDPIPLPVRWRPVTGLLSDHEDSILDTRGRITSAPLNLAGHLGDVLPTYGTIPSGRLVVLGRPGAGKSVLALRFVVDHLSERRPSDPVPVLFSIGSWDPTTTALRSWLTRRLLRDHPDLVAPTVGGWTLADALVQYDLILPVLDGFDEIAPGLRRAALEVLSSTSLPLLLTSRTDEYEEAVTESDVLTKAAVVQLIDLCPADLAPYLPRTTRPTTAEEHHGTAPTTWDPVLRNLRERPGEPAHMRLAEVLTTPLMVGLARTIYSDTPRRDPKELLDDKLFPSVEALEAHLLDSFVPTVYRDQPTSVGGWRKGWDTDRVRHWLGHLANHVDRRGGDLEWWRLGDSLPAASRIRTVMVVCALATALINWLVFAPLNAAISVRPPRWEMMLADGPMIGLLVGLVFSLIYWLMIVRGVVKLEPVYLRVRLFGRGPRPSGLPRTLATRFAAGVVGGALIGLGFGITVTALLGLRYGLVSDIGLITRITLVNVMLFSLLFGAAGGIAAAVVTVLEAPMDITSATGPIELLKASRTTALRLAAVLVPMLAIAIAAGGQLLTIVLQDTLGPFAWGLSGVVQGLSGAVQGVAGGMMGGFCYVLAFTAWGQWLTLTRIRLPLANKLPWDITAFLDDAYRRGVLRQYGAVYQFRHARLQDRLRRIHRD